MTTLAEISTIYVPNSCLEAVYKAIKKAGDMGMEAVALWAGRTHGKNFQVTTTIIPQQTAGVIENGLLYSVDGDELYRINKWLYEHHLTMIAQLHSHPRKAYHSEVDDRYPIMATIGGLSVVIPDFGFSKFKWKTLAVYRLTDTGTWKELSKTHKKTLIQIC
jgi:hypothetical protein